MTVNHLFGNCINLTGNPFASFEVGDEQSRMARADVIGDIKESFLSCTICMQPFKRPKALPCLHTFCEGCVRDYFCSRYEGTGQFPCPICRQVIYIPFNGVAGFPDNHFITSLQDTVGEQCGPYSLPHDALTINTSNVNNQSGYSSIETSGEKSPLLRSLSYSYPVSYKKKRFATLINTFGEFGLESQQLVHISGLALSILTDDILVADCSLNKILIFSLSGDCRGGFVCDCSIRDVAVTRAGTVLVTVSRSGNSILREYGFDGRLLASHGSFHRHENPFGLTITSRGKILITSLQHNLVNVYSDRKRLSIKFGSRGSGPNHFLMPYYITVNSRDDVIVSDSGNHRIKIHQNDGTIRLYFGSQGSQEGELFYPMGVCTDRYDNIYVADANNHRVQMFSPIGTFLAFPVVNTFDYGVDVKPINVLVVGDKLLVSLRGTKFAQIHVYKWDVSSFKVLEKSDSGLLSSCCGLFSSHKSSMTYDEI